MSHRLPVSSTSDVDWRAPASSGGSPAPSPSAAPAAASWCSRRTPSGWCLCSSACPWKTHRAVNICTSCSLLDVLMSDNQRDDRFSSDRDQLEVHKGITEVTEGNSILKFEDWMLHRTLVQQLVTDITGSHKDDPVPPKALKCALGTIDLHFLSNNWGKSLF